MSLLLIRFSRSIGEDAATIVRDVPRVKSCELRKVTKEEDRNVDGYLNRSTGC